MLRDPLREVKLINSCWSRVGVGEEYGDQEPKATLFEGESSVE